MKEVILTRRGKDTFQSMESTFLDLKKAVKRASFCRNRTFSSKLKDTVRYSLCPPAHPTSLYIAVKPPSPQINFSVHDMLCRVELAGKGMKLQVTKM